MKTSDTETRQNPYTLVFGADAMDDRLFPPIAEEAEARGQPLDDPDRFLFLSSVGRLLQAIAGAEDAGYDHQADQGEPGDAGEPTHEALEPGADAPGGHEAEPLGAPEYAPPTDLAAPAPEEAEPEVPEMAAPPSEFRDRAGSHAETRGPGAQPEAGGAGAAEVGPGGSTAPQPGTGEAGADEALRQYGRLLYHAFHYWRDHKPTRRVDEDGLRWLLDEVTNVGDWTLEPPAPSGYLQLPRNLVWAEPAPGLTPEPADGFFWRLVQPEDGAATLHVLLVLGVRPDRAGFSVVPAAGVLDDEDHWADIDARPDGTDFETTLPGGDMDELYSVQNAAEVLKLASLCFWKLDPTTD